MELWDFAQQVAIDRLRGSQEALAHEVADRHGSTQADLQRFEERLNRMALICQAMDELMRQNGNYTDGMLREKIQEIDLRDGRRDGRYTPPTKKCPRCDAMICRTFNRCLFCGYEDRMGAPFNG